MNKGKIVTAKPMTESTIGKIKKLLVDDPKWHSLFVVSVNSAFRASDLLKLKVDEIEDDGNRIVIFKKEMKTSKNRRGMLGTTASKVLRGWIKMSKPATYIWPGQRGRHTYGFYSWLLKRWVVQVGDDPKGISTHSTRKAWVKIHIERHKTPMHVLMRALSHSSEAQVLAYAGITPRDLEVAFSQEI